MENNESVQDVSSESSSPSPESQSSSNVVEQNSQQASPSESKQETPFHEHPRFKELINQRNEFSQRLQDYEKRFQELNSRIEQSQPKAPTPENKLLERLKSIDPEFGSWAEQQHNARMQLEKQLQDQVQWRQSQEASTFRNQLNSSLEKLHMDHKVPEAMRDVYQASLQAVAQANPNLGLQDLPNVYKGIHEKISKYVESVKRDALTEYSKSKVKDAAIPSTPKGPSPKPGTANKTQYSKDPAEARAQVVANAMKGLRGNNS